MTNDDLPYWNIRPIEQPGSATILSKKLQNFIADTNLFDNNKVIIGIFDNDSRGIQEFNSLKEKDFDFYNGSRLIKKHKKLNIFALKLPIPPELSFYEQDRQEFNFFEIEHYFPLDFLKEHKAVKETGLNNIYEIKDKKKKILIKEAKKIKDKTFFKNFVYLFEIIDKITGVEKDYIID